MPAYVYAFGLIFFHPVASDHQPMVSAPGLLQNIRHVPGSDRVILDLGGKTERTFSTQIRVAPDELVAIEAALGTSAPLTVAGVYWERATLVKLDNHSMTPRGEYHQYDASWVVG